MRLIEKNKKNFEYPPVGPLGMTLKIKNSKWAYACEQVITSKSMNSFLVNSRSKKDRILLNSLMKQAQSAVASRGGRDVFLPSINSHPYHKSVYDGLSSFTEYTSVLSQLECDDVNVLK
jgi:hypothetical protein